MDREDLDDDAAEVLTDYTSTGKDAYEAARDDGIAWARGESEASAWANIYHVTQERLNALGIDEVTALRGFKVDRDSPMGRFFADAQPGETFTSVIDFASFSTKKQVSTNYANAGLKDDQIGVTIRRTIKKEDIVASHYTDKGLKTEKEVIAKSDGEQTSEVVQVDDRAAAKQRAKSQFGTGRFLGRIDLNDLVKDRMVGPNFYKD